MDSFISPDVRNMADSDGIQFGSFELAKSKGGRKLTLLGSDFLSRQRKALEHWMEARIFLRPKVKEQKHNSCTYQSLDCIDFLDFLDFGLAFNFWAGVGTLPCCHLMPQGY